MKISKYEKMVAADFSLRTLKGAATQLVASTEENIGLQEKTGKVLDS